MIRDPDVSLGMDLSYTRNSVVQVDDLVQIPNITSW